LLGGVQELKHEALRQVRQAAKRLGRINTFNPVEARAQRPAAPNDIKDTLPRQCLRGMLPLRAKMARRRGGVIVKPANPPALRAGRALSPAIAAILIAPCEEIPAEGG
jgi:hypothetical protein